MAALVVLVEVLGAVVEMTALLVALLAVAMTGVVAVKLTRLVLVEKAAAVLDLTLVAVAEVPAVIVEMTALWMMTAHDESESVIVFHNSPIPYHTMRCQSVFVRFKCF